MEPVEIVELEEEEEEEEECEDWCFVCKDGGELMLCDYKDCPKVYHDDCFKDDCAKKGISVRANEETLICRWHTCYTCKKKRPKLCCFCCPNAVCEGCVTHAEFILLKDNKGLCNECQEYVSFVEEIQQYDAAGGKIDLADRNTFEGLFLEYWEIIKNQEDLTFDDVRASKSQKKGGAKLRYKDDPKFSLNDVHTSKSRKKSTKPKHKDPEDYRTAGKTKKKEFIGWGSKPLIDFLTSIGEDTKDEMSQDTVVSVIRRYIRQKNLLDREKKKRFRCDEKLYPIFRKRSVNHRKISKLLDSHFKENVEQSEYITLLERGFSEKNEKVLVPCNKQRTEMSDEEICEKEVKPEMRSTGLATINADNIKLVYLRKSLVVELSKQNENFGEKVVGSFVKVKNDPRDSVAYQILQVKGIKFADDQREGVFLYLNGMASDVSISKLDDSDITEEEIKDFETKSDERPSYTANCCGDGAEG